MWKPHGIKKIKEINPDIVVCDFFARVGIYAADEMGIPSIVNIPGPVYYINDLGLLPIVRMKSASNWFGRLYCN